VAPGAGLTLARMQASERVHRFFESEDFRSIG
jgi:hypothetical protein